MSLRYEQYTSLKFTREFLRDLLTVDDYPKTKKEMREWASSCLKHFPTLHENGQPMWSQDDFTEDVGHVEQTILTGTVVSRTPLLTGKQWLGGETTVLSLKNAGGVEVEITLMAGLGYYGLGYYKDDRIRLTLENLIPPD